MHKKDEDDRIGDTDDIDEPDPDNVPSVALMIKIGKRLWKSAIGAYYDGLSEYLKMYWLFLLK